MEVWTRVVGGDGERSSDDGYIALGIQGWLYIFWPEQLERVPCSEMEKEEQWGLSEHPMGDVNLIVTRVGLELKEEVLEGDTSLSIARILSLSLPWAQPLLQHQCPAHCLACSLCSVSTEWVTGVVQSLELTADLCFGGSWSVTPWTYSFSFQGLMRALLWIPRTKNRL